MKYSFIIPAYNSANHIERCIESIVQQKTNKKYEIILINDGSTDNLKDIVTDLMIKYPKIIKYYEQDNQGVSVARNYGVKKSSGEYITFVDADDKISNNFFNNLNKTIKNEDFDIIKTKVQCIENVKYDGRFDLPIFYKLNGKEALRKFCGSSNIFATPWSYIFKRSFFVEKNFLFKSNTAHEDLALIPIILSVANNVTSMEWCGYEYIKRENSMSTKSDEKTELKRIDDFLFHTYNLIKYFSKKYKKDSDIFINYFYNRSKIKVNNLKYAVKLKMDFEILTEIEYFVNKKFDKTSIYNLPENYKIAIENAVNLVVNEFKTNLIGVVLGGSCGKGCPVPNWSDIDLYIILKKHDFISIQKLYNQLSKIPIHVGTTFYSINEISNDILDSKTKVMIYEKEHLKVNPTLYGYSLFKSVNYNQIVKNDTDNLPNILQIFRRMILKIESKEQEIEKKLVKVLILLLKCYLNMNYFFTHGYELVVKVFLEIYNSRSTNKYEFDIMNMIENLEENKIEVLNFSKRVFDFIISEMETIKMEKRVSSRGIIIEDDYVYAMFRRRIKDDGFVKEYYVLPGGGINEGETLEENVVREMKEEFSVDVEIKKYLGKDESDETVAHFFSCSIINGIPTLGGEELERCSESNYYEIRKISIKDLDKIDILGKDMILKAYKNE